MKIIPPSPSLIPPQSETQKPYLCAYCGENEAEHEESICGDCNRKIRKSELSWSKKAPVDVTQKDEKEFSTLPALVNLFTWE